MLVFAKENKRPCNGKRGTDSLTLVTHTKNAQLQVATSVYSEIASLPEARKQRVLNIRQRLKEGTYDLDKYLDASLSKVLNELRK